MITESDRKYLMRKKAELVDGCPKCHGRSAHCDCAKLLSLEFSKIKANIPEMYREFTLEQLDHPELEDKKALLKRYENALLTGAAKDLLLTGSSGTAKSSVAAALLVKMLQARKTCYFFNSALVVKDVLTSVWDKHVEPDPRLQILKNADLIVIDNFNIIMTIPAMIRALITDTLRTREMYGKRTIIIMNGVTIDKITAETLSALNLTKIQLVGFDYKEKILKVTRRTKNGK